METIGRMALGGLLVLTFVFASMLWTVRGLFGWLRSHFSGFDDLSAKREGGKVILSGALVDAARAATKTAKRAKDKPPPADEIVAMLDAADRHQARAMATAQTEPIPGEKRAWSFGTLAMIVVFIVAGVAWAACRVGG